MTDCGGRWVIGRIQEKTEVRVAANGSEMGNPYYSLNLCQRSYVVCTFSEIFFSECSSGSDRYNNGSGERLHVEIIPTDKKCQNIHVECSVDITGSHVNVQT